MMNAGRLMILIGILLVAVGLILTYSNLFSFIKLGRLPGDIHYRRGNFTFYFPLTTCIIVSVTLTLILYFFRK